MLCVIPFHCGDKHLAVQLANWIAELGNVKSHTCLLVTDTDETGVIEPLRTAFKSVTVFRPRIIKKQVDGKFAYFLMANQMWQGTAWKIFAQDKVPWLWLEPDAIPTRPTWLNEIAEEYKMAGKPFMGCIGQSKVKMLNGVAVYPANVSAFAPLALNAEKCPWDMNGASQILPKAHITNLIQHVYQVGDKPPTFPKDKDILSQESAIFHRVKDGSLFGYLRTAGYTRGQSSEPHKLVDKSFASSNLAPATSVSKTFNQKDWDDEMLGEVTENKSRLEEFQKLQRTPVVWDVRAHGNRLPKEGDRSNGMIFRDGEWKKDLPSTSQAVKAQDRPSLMPDVEVQTTLSGGDANTQHTHAASSPSQSTFDVPVDREALVRDTVAVLKKLCTAPRFTSQVRKELKSQGVIR